MVTHVFICNKCDGDLDSRVFEIDYPDYKTAEISPIPPCPKCGTNKYVTRFFGHNIFAPPKKRPDPERFVPVEPNHKKGIMSIGMRLNEEEMDAARSVVNKLVEVTSMEVVENNDPEKDVLEETFKLKKGTLDREIFDMRHKKMMKELDEGKKISGFFHQVIGDANN